MLWPEEDGRGQDSLEALDDSVTAGPVFVELEELQELGGACKVDKSAFLLNGERGNADWDEVVLSIRKSKVGVRHD